jgi:epoxyqueuosine reductase
VVIDEDFNEYYQILPDHPRYDPGIFFEDIQSNMDDGKASESRYNDLDGMARRMRSKKPGYSIVDYAFKDAAGTCEYSPDGSRGMNTGYYSWTPLGRARKPPGIPSWEAPPEDVNKVITKAAKYYGALEVGYCMMDKRFVYARSENQDIIFEDVNEPYITDKKAVIPEKCKYVIVILVPMEFTENSYAPTPLEVTSNMGYSRMHFTTGTLAEMIRGLGYTAIPCGNDTAFSVPLAIKAGLGHLSRNGRLIHWKYGQLARISKIFTDLPLKPAEKMAPKGIVEFCEICQKCAQHCPSRSVPFGPRTKFNAKKPNLNPGALKWYNNESTCSDYWHKVGTGCSICLRCCDWTNAQGIMHNVVTWCIKNVPQINKLWPFLDDFLGRGKMSDPDKYWDIPIEKHKN